ncbi:MAG: hypothetical protein U0Y10_04270 [Spirosomataceae bacterium]
MLFLIILIVSTIAQFFLPWWVIAPVAFLAAFWKGTSASSTFIAGCLALFLSWAGMAFFANLGSGEILVARVATIFFKSPQSYLLIAVTGLVGGLVGGFSALSGYFVKGLVDTKS